MAARSPATTAAPEELARFAAIAEKWWDPDGVMKPLHQFNPVRLTFIRDTACAHFDRPVSDTRPLDGLKVLDIGCGGGLLAEPVARMGATVTAIDAAEKNLHIARAHAQQSGVAVDYRHATPEKLAAAGDRYDVVLTMEVVEHVADLGLFVTSAGQLLRPGGLLFAATLNRTVKSLLLAKIGAEYILRWLPRGTHSWRKFVKPSELGGHLRRAGLSVTEITGVSYNPVTDHWRLNPADLDVNYMLVARKPD